MPNRVLALDYDGTLATAGRVGEGTLVALERFRAFGGRLILVTGRLLEDLLEVFPAAAGCARIVAENGAVLYAPAGGRLRRLGPAPDPEVVQSLAGAGVTPLSVGRVIISTTRANAPALQRAIAGRGLQVIANQDALMVLPAGVDKASGLQVALDELGIAPREVVGVGDAENDVTFLDLCGLAVAVANALPAVKRRAARVLPRPDGAGISELISSLITGDPVEPGVQAR